MADKEYPLSLQALEELQRAHVQEQTGSSFVHAFSSKWDDRTSSAVQPASEIQQTLHAKRPCCEIVTQGCLKQLLQELPQFPTIKGVLRTLLAPVGQDRRSEQLVLRVRCGGGENIVVASLVAQTRRTEHTGRTFTGSRPPVNGILTKFASMFLFTKHHL